jgi:glycosyltransferase involved in cell wall biosynthesis
MSAADSKSTVALIPAFNEADKIGATVEAVRSIVSVERVIVIDDGSKDATADVAGSAGAEVLRLDRNRGKGAALQVGVGVLLRKMSDGSPAPDIVLLLDGDLGASAVEAENLLHPVAEGLADMTIAVLPTPPGSGGFGVVKDLARREIRELGGGYNAQAPLSGQRALSWECLQAVLPFAQGYGVEVALTIRALQQDFRILEVMLEMYHRTTGKTMSGFIHRGKQYLDVYRTIQQLTRG